MKSKVEMKFDNFVRSKSKLVRFLIRGLAVFVCCLLILALFVICIRPNVYENAAGYDLLDVDLCSLLFTGAGWFIACIIVYFFLRFFLSESKFKGKWVLFVEKLLLVVWLNLVLLSTFDSEQMNLVPSIISIFLFFKFMFKDKPIYNRIKHFIDMIFGKDI